MHLRTQAMTLSQLQIEGDAARVIVRRAHPAATSTYADIHTAQIYDATSGRVLGEAQACEFAVEHAWIKVADDLERPTHPK